MYKNMELFRIEYGNTKKIVSTVVLLILVISCGADSAARTNDEVVPYCVYTNIPDCYQNISELAGTTSILNACTFESMSLDCSKSNCVEYSLDYYHGFCTFNPTTDIATSERSGTGKLEYAFPEINQPELMPNNTVIDGERYCPKNASCTGQDITAKNCSNAGTEFNYMVMITYRNFSFSTSECYFPEDRGASNQLFPINLLILGLFVIYGLLLYTII